MALATIDDDTASRLIHHSDRGSQYCSAAYTIWPAAEVLEKRLGSDVEKKK